jgi:hypothetical protein
VAAPQADALYASLLALDRTLVERARRAWFRLHPKGLQESFVQDFIPQVLPDLVAAQTAAAALGVMNAGGSGPSRGSAQSQGRQSLATPQASLTTPAQGHITLPDLPQPHVVPSRLAGVASDGRPLTDLLVQPLIETYVNLDGGTPIGQALESGFDSMDRILTTQVQDAARIGSSVAMVADKKVTHYVRAVEPGACGRCIVLAGRRYKWSQGFLRHPHCRCLNVAETADVGAPSPQTLYDGMSQRERERAFTVAGAQAIEHGADIGKVVNARRGMTTTVFNQQKLLTTTSGARRGQIRLMPEAILQLSGGDRDLAVDLLIRNGFITR